MIIDKILDRKDGTPYNAREFYNAMMEYEGFFKFDPPFAISRAMDSGTEADVKAALCHYIISQEYNPEICDYINSVIWVEG